MVFDYGVMSDRHTSGMTGDPAEQQQRLKNQLIAFSELLLKLEANRSVLSAKPSIFRLCEYYWFIYVFIFFCF